MKTLLATLCVLATMAPAVAASPGTHSTGATSRYSTGTMSCAAVQDRIHTEGAVVLRYPTSTPAMPRFGRYVDSVRFCSSDELASFTKIPTADNKSCLVKMCVDAR